MRKSQFTSAVVLTPNEGMATDCQTALRSFGLKKLAVVTEFGELQKQIIENSFDIILVDTDCLQGADKNGIVERLRSTNNHKQGVFVALSRVNSREELLEIRGQGFAGVLIKPISVGMMEQALSEVIERQRSNPIDREALARVHEKFLHGQTFEAERMLSIWLEKDAESLPGLTLLALHQFKKQEYHRANNTIQKVLKINSNYLPALQLKTRISLRLGNLTDAYQSLAVEEKVVAFMDAKRAESLAHSLSKSQIEELSFCEEFATREGITALLINLGLQLSKTGKSVDSFNLYHRALGPLEDENFRFIALFNRGRLFLTLRRNAEARQDLQMARQLAPDELHLKIDELLSLCNVAESAAHLGSSEKPKLRPGAMAVPDLLSMGSIPKPKAAAYKPFNKDEVLQLVFLGKMREETVPPESVEEWLQMKKRLLHILFLEELPLLEPTTPQETVEPEQGAP